MYIYIIKYIHIYIYIYQLAFRYQRHNPLIQVLKKPCHDKSVRPRRAARRSSVLRRCSGDSIQVCRRRLTALSDILIYNYIYIYIYIHIYILIYILIYLYIYT